MTNFLIHFGCFSLVVFLLVIIFKANVLLGLFFSVLCRRVSWAERFKPKFASSCAALYGLSCANSHLLDRIPSTNTPLVAYFACVLTEPLGRVLLDNGAFPSLRRPD